MRGGLLARGRWFVGLMRAISRRWRRSLRCGSGRCRCGRRWCGCSNEGKYLRLLGMACCSAFGVCLSLNQSPKRLFGVCLVVIYAILNIKMSIQEQRSAVWHTFRQRWKELGNEAQCLLDLVLRPVGEVLHHGHIGKSSTEALAARGVTLFVT